MAAKLHLVDEHKRQAILRRNNNLKAMFSKQPNNIFTGLNIRYFGPTDGHDVMGLVRILSEIKNHRGPKVLHIITKKGIDKKLPFIIYIFVLIILYIIWGLMVEDKMTVIRDNEKEIETLKIEYYQKELTLTGLNQKSKVENLLLQNGITDLKAPVDPPQRILVNDAE